MPSADGVRQLTHLRGPTATRPLDQRFLAEKRSTINAIPCWPRHLLKCCAHGNAFSIRTIDFQSVAVERQADSAEFLPLKDAASGFCSRGMAAAIARGTGL